jgi:hypothetical protein
MRGFTEKSSSSGLMKLMLRRVSYRTDGAEGFSQVGPEGGKKLSGSRMGSEHEVDRILLLCWIARASSIRPLNSQPRKLPSHSNVGMFVDADRKKFCTASSASR